MPRPSPPARPPAAACPTAAELPTALKSAYIANPTGLPGLYTSPSNPAAVINAGFLGNVASEWLPPATSRLPPP
jgi:hypothetical protein